MSEVPPQEMIKVTKEDIYVYLAETYGYSANEIALMNPHQQYVLYRGKRIVNMSAEQYAEFARNKR